MSILKYFIVVALAVTICEAAIEIEAPVAREKPETPSTSSAAKPEPSAIRETPLRLAINLIDGSHVIGVPRIKSITVQTSYAKMDIPLKQITSVKIDDEHETASLELQNGDKLKGVLDITELEMETVFGKHSIGIDNVQAIDVHHGQSSLPENLRKGLLLHYSFENRSEKVTDKSDKGNHGQVHGAQWTPRGKVGGAYEFDGVASYLESSKPLIIEGAKPWSTCCWAKCDPASRRFDNIVSIGKAEHPYGIVGLAQGGSASSLALNFWNTSGNINDIEYSGTFATTFRFISVVYDGSILTVYVDSRQQFTKTVMLNMLSAPVRIGGRTGGYHGQYLKGQIDEVMIFNRALSEQDIKQLYNSRK